MSYPERYLSPSEAAAQLGVSTKALRLYEQRGLVAPLRTEAGWRAYGPAEMSQAGEVAALRALGLSLTQVAKVLKGDPKFLEPALAAHEATLEGRIRQLTDSLKTLRTVRADLTQGRPPAISELARLVQPATEVSVAFDLPWPWGGERFELQNVRPLNYIIGPLGSGKTRLAQTIAETLPDTSFVGLDRLNDEGAVALGRMDRDSSLKSRVAETVRWFTEEGATTSPALLALIVTLESSKSVALVIDMVEAGLDQDSQEAVAAYLRHRGSDARSLFILTRSSAILDLTAVGPAESIIHCPANHSPPTLVAPYPGAPGFEAVASCLASPEVRARTEGVIALRPQIA
ncbi:MerR family transcriptional regulator [Pelagibius sp. Alg239-R121]|uniref:MerR family transcriptional regulator n=1 Tax=Pelagibius sp. Alg239-R121 TaxID=2993448 RepID=UPI0024A61C24|nr:MerR family transcriptional regulator [Pelagibius sp. Alg239-R121]